jgi:Protein of unknown function (DUF998)
MKNSKVSLGSTVLFVVLLTLLHFLEPEINPTWRFISEYALGNYGWLMPITFFAWASAFLFLFFALRKYLKNTTGRIGLLCLIICSVGMLMAGIFTTDPITTDIHTTSGSIHSIGGTLGVAMPFAALFICISVFKNQLWVSVKKQILWATIIALVGFVVSAGSLGYMFSQSNGITGPDVLVGIPTRFEILSYCIWLIVMASSSFKITNN